MIQCVFLAGVAAGAVLGALAFVLGGQTLLIAGLYALAVTIPVLFCLSLRGDARLRARVILAK